MASAKSFCANNLRQVGFSLHLFTEAKGAFPPGVVAPAADAKHPFMGWQLHLMPYIEQQAVWDEAVEAYRRNSNFLADPPHPGASRVIKTLICNSDSRVIVPQTVPGGAAKGFTSYLGVSGSHSKRGDGMLFCGSAVRPLDVQDGASNTLFVGERPPSADLVFGWWYAGWGQDQDGDGDMVLGVRATNVTAGSAYCPPGPYRYGVGRFEEQCSMFHFWSPHVGGANFLLVDGSVRLIGYSADDLMPALATRAGGEAVAVPE
ncbi:DUF1559 domain-containing protein [Gemmata sp. JC673]|uniref:DUF1559 domain-containing protein n=2 Tax=Gemmata algarum TaxID=2975278 RepID=A0ABU5F1K1_9BACT|nr:DUF1559 domain-containing protein [Gemmata algarum]MDY3561064.1 DUF1559 domain-containing protein [Gemmata algarum]